MSFFSRLARPLLASSSFATPRTGAQRALLSQVRCFSNASCQNPGAAASSTEQQALSSAENRAYHAGLRNTVFTNECEITNESQVIPIFRIMGYDGVLQGGWQSPFSAEECVERYKFMVRLSVYDLMLYNIQRQGTKLYIFLQQLVCVCVCIKLLIRLSCCLVFKNTFLL